jgi:crotonobetaine/carnitine-CoA ligase
VIDGYGLTECPGVCQNPIYGRKKIGSMGIPAIHPDPRIKLTEMIVVDNEHRELPSGEVGELLVRSTLLMKGYFKEPEQTSTAIRDGWFHTGDYVYRDADGYYFFVDRKKDIIRRRGENISSVEVEMVINTHPEVAESAVIAVPSSMSEDDVKAFIVLKGGGKTTSEEIVDWCLERLADFKIPRYIEFREQLPKTPSQRVAKYLLRQGRSEGGKDMMEYVRQTISKKKSHTS